MKNNGGWLARGLVLGFLQPALFGMVQSKN